MKKIPTIFKRNPENMRELLDELHPDCLWVFEGEGVATRKYDGTCVKIEKGQYYKRREVKKGKNAPDNFIEEMEDLSTGKRVGWVAVEDTKENKYHIQAFNNALYTLEDGTYELCGPKIQGNPEKFEDHILVKHSKAIKYDCDIRTYSGIKNCLCLFDIEGLVFHHPDGRMAKIKKRDFGLKR